MAKHLEPVYKVFLKNSWLGISKLDLFCSPGLSLLIFPGVFGNTDPGCKS